eukprot:scaffold3944_cov74-Cyclotella_meneghiniana.AAC.1
MLRLWWSRMRSWSPSTPPAANTAAATTAAAAAAATTAAGTNTGVPGTNVMMMTGTGASATPAGAPPPGGLLNTLNAADISNEALCRLLDYVNILSEAAIRKAHAPATGGGSISGSALDFTRVQQEMMGRKQFFLLDAPAPAAADPPELIAASGIHPNGIGEWPMKLRWSAVPY